MARILAHQDVEHELLEPDDARSRWPQITVDTEALWHPAAGVIDAESAVWAMVDQAVRHRARLLTGWELAMISTTSTGYRLTAANGKTLDAEKIVVSVGGWLPHLLSGLPLPAAFRAALPPFQVRQEQTYHFPYRDEATNWPTFIHMVVRRC